MKINTILKISKTAQYNRTFWAIYDNLSNASKQKLSARDIAELIDSIHKASQKAYWDGVGEAA